MPTYTSFPDENTKLRIFSASFSFAETNPPLTALPSVMMDISCTQSQENPGALQNPLPGTHLQWLGPAVVV